MENSSQQVLVAVMSLHNKAIHPPTPKEKEKAKEYADRCACPEWQDRFIAVDRTKFSFAFSLIGLIFMAMPILTRTGNIPSTLRCSI